jgi:hypothetical protein
VDKDKIMEIIGNNRRLTGNEIISLDPLIDEGNYVYARCEGTFLSVGLILINRHFFRLIKA